MTLAEKISRLRKELHWSQEELAEKVEVSRQSVSKWESGNSVPELNKIILLAEIFNVTIDSLIKDEQTFNSLDSPINEPDVFEVKINLEQAEHYVANKIASSILITKGVIICVCSLIPLFLLLALTKAELFNLTNNIATVIGIISMLVMVPMGISYFIKSNPYKDNVIDGDFFQLEKGVHDIYHEKLQHFMPIYHRNLSIGIFCFITSCAPLIFSNVYSSNATLPLLMLVVLFVMIAIGLHFVIPNSAQYEAFNHILQSATQDAEKTKQRKRIEQFAKFYWPLLTAIFLAWSLWTMDWGTTWIIWPVGALLFSALVGLIELRAKQH